MPAKVNIEGPVTAEVGKPVTYTATGSDGTGQYEFRFWLFDSMWISTQTYSQVNKWVWTPQNPGKYKVGVWIRTLSGNTPDEKYESVSTTPVEVEEVTKKVSVSVNGQTFITSFPVKIEIK